MGFTPVYIQTHIAFQFIAASQDARLQYPFHVRAFQLLESLPGLFLFRFRKFVRCHCFLNHIHIVKGDTGCPVGIAPLYVSRNLVAFGNLLFFFTGKKERAPAYNQFQDNSVFEKEPELPGISYSYQGVRVLGEPALFSFRE